MRNRKVTVAMKKTYFELTKDVEPLSVFCVSNEHYGRHMVGYGADDIPIGIEATGIPHLRMFVSGLPATSKLATLREYCEGILPSVVGSLDLWSNQSVVERREELREKIEEPCEVSVHNSMSTAELTK